jgi:D-3-phosphoglycerate dehydrogenase
MSGKGERMGKVLIQQHIADEGIQILKEAGLEIVNGSGAEEADLIRDIADCDALLLRTAPCTAKVIAAGRNLKIIARHGAGYNNIDLEAADRQGIWVTNAPDATPDTVAEFTLGALIAAARKIVPLSRTIEEDDFFYKYNDQGTNLNGKTLAVIGFGRIGKAVAMKAHFGLGMKIIAYNPHIPDQKPDYVRFVSREEAFQEADFLSLHMPLTPKDRGSIGEREFDLMKESAFFINCARGELVDEKALLHALQEQKIAGAFLDVLNGEPFPADHPFLSLKNVTLTPHIASNTADCMALLASQAASQIVKVLNGEEPDWPVNHPARS